MLSTDGLVGRQRELEALSAELEAAGGGRAGGALVVGEAGIGKTALSRAFAHRARADGARVLWGSCHEGDWQPPYAPWAEALQAVAPFESAEQLEEQLGSDAAVLAALLPLRTDVVPPLLPPAEARLRLFAAVRTLLASLAGDRPCVVVLDDLHWADRDTLALLGSVSQAPLEGRLLIVATCRDLALERDGPLADALADLVRQGTWQWLRLSGLDESEVGTYLATGMDAELPSALVHTVSQATEGNPFYVREVVRHLVEEGKLVHRPDRWSTDFSLAELGIPEGVRLVVRRRVARLSEPTRTLLQAASVFTGNFDFASLQALTGLDERGLLDALDEALAGGLLRHTEVPEEPYTFSHAIVRHTLDDRFNPDRRARLHRRAAEALAAEPAPPGRAAAIAEHYHASRGLPGAERGVAHCLAAAGQASAEVAPRRVVRLLQMAADLAPAADSTTRADVLSRLALAHAEALMFDEAEVACRHAVEALEQSGAGPDRIAALLGGVAASLKHGAPRTAWEPLAAQALELLESRRDERWARVGVLIEPVEPVLAGPVYISRWSGYDPSMVAALSATGSEEDASLVLEPFGPRTLAETTAVIQRARTWRSPAARMRALDLAGRDMSLRHGRAQEAIDCYGQLLDLSRQVGSVPWQVEAHVQLALCCGLLGELARADAELARGRVLAGELWPSHRLHLMADVSAPAVVGYARGTADWPALAKQAVWFVSRPEAGRNAFGVIIAALAALSHAMAGDDAEARRLAAAVVEAVERMQPTDHAMGGSLWFATGAAWELEDGALGRRLRAIAERLEAQGAYPGPVPSFAPAQARLIALTEGGAAAAPAFARARVDLEARGYGAVRALVDHDEAVARLRSGQPDPELAAVAAHACAELGMSGWAQRAQALRARARGRPGGLTDREAEVLGLVAAGRTSREIASQLVVSEATVQRHVANIYRKIGARNRAQATAFAIQHEIAARVG